MFLLLQVFDISMKVYCSEDLYIHASSLTDIDVYFNVEIIYLNPLESDVYYYKAIGRARERWFHYRADLDYNIVVRA